MKDEKVIANFIKCLEILYKYSKLYVFINFIMAVVLGVLPVISLLIMQVIINSLQMNRANFHNIFLYIVLYTIIDIITSVVTSKLSLYTNKTQLNYSKSLELDMLKKATSLGLHDFEDSETHNIISRARIDAANKIFKFYDASIGILRLVIGALSTISIIALYNPLLILIVIILPIVKCIISVKISRIVFDVTKRRTTRERKAGYISHLFFSGLAFKELKLFKLKDYFLKDYDALKKLTIEEDLSISKKTLQIYMILNVLDHIITGALFVFLIRDAFIGRLLIGDVVTYNRCLNTIKTNVQSIFTQIDTITRDALFINEYFRFQNLDPDTHGSKELSGISSVQVRNLSYKYPGMDHYVLKNISFTIEKPEKAVFIGRNGSGKTTLFKLMLGFYKDYEGEILINGVDLKHIDLNSYYDYIGCIFQDYFRFEATVRENVGFGNIPEINNDERILFALMSAGFNQENSKGLNLNTSLGSWFDDAKQLSGGEWQRIALARAFTKDADLYILDEPDSSLDPVTEHEILERYISIMRDKIGIFSSHKLSTLDNLADRIMVFEHGQLIESGNRETLLQQDGLYHELNALKNRDYE